MAGTSPDDDNPASAGPSEKNPPDRDDFPIVGIGASAGGLEALTRLFAQIPVPLGMAFVVVQHLDPTHESHLVDLLGKTATLQVTEAREGQEVRPDVIYVIPPNASLTLGQGILHLSPRGDANRLHPSIDLFMRSLASDRAESAIGVLLSGTGTDGTAGLAEIKAAGGITFAQDEESAKHPGMPGNAVAEGVVDQVLSPETMARELAALAGHTYFARESRKTVQSLQEPEPGFPRILSILRSEAGVDFAQYRDTTLKRRILRRMALNGTENAASYARKLKDDPAEIRALYRDFLINVTSFFREPGLFEALKTHVFPDIHRNRSQDAVLRIWVAGCSTGEEAYSLAMALVEYQDDIPVRPAFQIFATDISESPALEKARAGIYPETIESYVEPERLKRFFTRESLGYRINQEIRERILFARHDVTADPPFSRMDLISCRNLLIYLSPLMQRKVIPTFHYALLPTGFLVLGNSETVGQAGGDLFDTVEPKLKIYSKRLTTPRNPPIQGRLRSAPSGRALRPDARAALPFDHERAADRILLRRFAPSGVLVNKDLDVLQFRGRTSPFLEPPQGDATFSLSKMATHSLFLELRSAVQEAGHANAPVIRRGVQFRDGSEIRPIDVEIIPVRPPDAGEPSFLILFQDGGKASNPSHAPAGPPVTRTPEEESELVHLRIELAAAHEYLQSIREQFDAVNEELKSSNEEILSSNEELQSTNEELETAKEELQSSNEELTTMNDELGNRNQELAQLNADLNNLIGNVSIPIVMLGNDLKIRRFTPQAAKALDLGPEDVGQPIGKIHPVLEVPDLEQTIFHVIAKVEPIRREIRDRDGKWYTLRVFPHIAPDNRVEGAGIVFMDIDEVKRSQEKLREYAEYTQAIVGTVREPFLILDEAMRIHSANGAFYRTFRIESVETEGQLLSEVGGGSWNIPGLRTLLDEVLPSDTPFEDFEWEQDFPGIGRRLLQLNARKLLQNGGRSQKILLAMEDITLRKQAERDLRLFKFICDLSYDPYYLMNRDGRILYVNRSAQSRLGYSETEFLALKLGDVDPAHSGDAFTALFERAHAGPIMPFETEHITRRGERFQVECTVTGLRYEEEAFLLAVARDITERKRSAEVLRLSEEKLRQSQKVEAIGKLAGGVAHDFNNLLTAINGYSDLSLTMVDPGTPLHDNLEEIHKAGTRAASLTRQLLAYSRKQVLAPEVLDLNTVVTDMHRMLSRVIGEHIELVVHPEPGLGMVKADRGEMEQVLLNLVVNARDAMPEGGKITLETRNEDLEDEYPLVLPGAYSALVVSDPGTGMTADVKARIFDPFFTTKGAGKGSGLGLSMVQGIVAQSGGHISVHSELGVGSTFRIFLPQVGGKAGLPKAAEAKTLLKLHGSETLLLVEDEESVRIFAQKILEMHGYTVLTAGDGKSALDLVDGTSIPIHLLLTDIVMPGMDGHKVAEGFHRHRPESRILFMSGYIDDAVVRHSLMEAGSRFIQKPFTPTQLAQAVRDTLDAKTTSVPVA